MTPDNLAAKVETLISKTEKALAKQAIATQVELFDQMSVMLNGLSLKDGLIIQNQANRAILAQANEYFNKAMGDYYASLGAISNTIASLTSENAGYFSTLLDSFTPDAQYIKSLQKQTILQAESLLANEGIELTLKQPIVNILNQNINTGAAYKDLLNQLRTFIIGNDQVEGSLLRYSRQITTDTLFNYNRALQEAVSANSGLEWIKYVGGVTEGTKNKSGKSTGGTREFCAERMGRYYKKDDVEKWADRDWQGKRKGTTKSTIFIYAGGYNCKHQIVYVDESAVPKANKDAKVLGKNSKEVGDELQDKAGKIANKYGAKLTPINYKSYDSMVRKANDELAGNVGDIKDSVRNTIIADGKNIKNVSKEVGQLGVKGLKTQDFSSSSGYRGYISNPKLSNGVIGEIQVNTPEMIFAKEQPSIAKSIIGESKWNEIKNKTGLDGGLGHKYYEEDRKIIIDSKNPDPKLLSMKEEIQQKSRDYYKNFYYSYPDPWP